MLFLKNTPLSKDLSQHHQKESGMETQAVSGCGITRIKMTGTIDGTQFKGSEKCGKQD
jgi:hypothetical protein